jgi:hypothetical protein
MRNSRSTSPSGLVRWNTRPLACCVGNAAGVAPLPMEKLMPLRSDLPGRSAFKADVAAAIASLSTPPSSGASNCTTMATCSIACASCIGSKCPITSVASEFILSINELVYKRSVLGRRLRILQEGSGPLSDYVAGRQNQSPSDRKPHCGSATNQPHTHFTRSLAVSRSMRPAFFEQAAVIEHAEFVGQADLHFHPIGAQVVLDQVVVDDNSISQTSAAANRVERSPATAYTSRPGARGRADPQKYKLPGVTLGNNNFSVAACQPPPPKR